MKDLDEIKRAEDKDLKKMIKRIKENIQDSIDYDFLDNNTEYSLEEYIEDHLKDTLNQDSIFSDYHERANKRKNADKFKYICAFISETGWRYQGKYVYCSKKTFSKIEHFLAQQRGGIKRDVLFDPDPCIDIISEHETFKEARIKAREEIKEIQEMKVNGKYPGQAYTEEEHLSSGVNYMKELSAKKTAETEN